MNERTLSVGAQDELIIDHSFLSTVELAGASCSCKISTDQVMLIKSAGYLVSDLWISLSLSF